MCLTPESLTGIVLTGKHAIVHERLAIMDPDSGKQPLVAEDGSVQILAQPHDTRRTCVNTHFLPKKTLSTPPN